MDCRVEDEECGCPALGGYYNYESVFTRCDIAVTSVAATGACGGARRLDSGIEPIAGEPYAALYTFYPQETGSCLLVVTFANGFVYERTLSVTTHGVPCGSNPNGCGEEPGFDDNTGMVLIDSCGNAPLYPPNTPIEGCLGTLIVGGGPCPNELCPSGFPNITQLQLGTCCTCPYDDASTGQD